MCHTCQESFHTQKSLASHLKTDHGIEVNANKPVLKCCDCDEVFHAHHQLHKHRMKHSHIQDARLDNPAFKMPWEKEI